MDQSFLVGVNYWPADLFVDMWRLFNAEVIKRDFAKAKDYNIDVMRIFLAWDDFQPQPNRVDSRQLDNLGRVLTIADSLDLLVMPTLLVGHMSGVNWLPAWLKSEKINHTSRYYFYDRQESEFLPRSLYTDAIIVESQIQLVTQVVRAAQRHKSILAWDLTNEIDRVQPIDDAAFIPWQQQLIVAIRELDTIHPVTHGVHIRNGDSDGVTLSSLDALDWISVHSYPMYHNHNATDVTYVEDAITAAHSLSKPVILAEFGVPTSPKNQLETHEVTWQGKTWTQPFVGEQMQSDYFRRGLQTAIESGCKAALWWCWSDYNSKLFDSLPFSALPHERYFGLFRSDGSAKPAAHVIKQFVH